MKPYYQDKWVTIYHGDCREILPQLPNNSVDLVLTDPPYGVREDDWDNMTPAEFALFSMEWLSKVKRLKVDSIIFCYPDNAVHALCKMLFPFVRELIWHKPMGSQYSGSSEAKYWFSYELILFCHESITWEVCKPKYLDIANLLKAARQKAGLSRGAIDNLVRGKKTGLCYRWEEAACIPTTAQIVILKQYLDLDDKFDIAISEAINQKMDTLQKVAEKAARKADVLIHRTITNGLHPCQKPDGLLFDLIQPLTDINQTILDPFLGSGTTAYCAKKLNRKCMGIEIEEKYCEIAANRCRQEVMELTV